MIKIIDDINVNYLGLATELYDRMKHSAMETIDSEPAAKTVYVIYEIMDENKYHRLYVFGDNVHAGELVFENQVTESMAQIHDIIERNFDAIKPLTVN